MPSQSPAAGELALPSPLVSPPTVSSASEVKVTGLAAVPLTSRVPSTVRVAEALALTTTPLSIVSVTPSGIVRSQVRTISGTPAECQV